VAIVNHTFVKRFFQTKNPLGQRFQWGDRAMFTIVGVVDDVRISALEADPPPMIYLSMFQVESGASSRMAFVVRMSRAHMDRAVFRAIQQQIWSVDKDLPAYDTTTLEELVSDSVAQRRFMSLLMTAFAMTALLLACTGLFGVLSYMVSQRRRDLAVRMALGAERQIIFRMIVREGTILAVSGCGLGLVVFAIGERLIRSSLYQVSPFDPVTLLVATGLLIGVAVAACYLPARRAMESDPMVALRYE
jgi:predicted lysophospholipase L1 biosynthesis ABC-type transport system permease subunit